MRKGLWLGLMLVGSVVTGPWAMRGQILSDPCNTCQTQVVHCQRTRPVVQTHLREEKCTTYRDVVETRYRQECVVEHTPVTTCEDRVETVWVPQQVTRKVSKTVMVPQTKTRVVPYQVVSRVPQTTSRLVPYQTVHHVTETVPMVYGAPTVIGHAWSTPGPTPVAALPASPTPRTATPVVPHRAPSLSPSTNNNPGGWQTIRPRAASAENNYGYESDSDRLVPMPADDEPAVRKSTWRGNVPAAAAAWNLDRTYR